MESSRLKQASSKPTKRARHPAPEVVVELRHVPRSVAWETLWQWLTEATAFDQAKAKEQRGEEDSRTPR